jgi:hypothetical protein
MLRNILIVIGLLVALDPYLGFPQSVDKFILTGLGLSIVFLLTLARRGKFHHDRPASDVAPKILHVERTEVEDSPKMHIERTTTLDTEEVESQDGEKVMTEKKTTVVRRRKQRSVDVISTPESPSVE